MKLSSAFIGRDHECAGDRAAGKMKPWAPTLRSVLGLSRIDIALIVVGLLFGACSLTYPFGHDQGVHYYVGREWLQHGSLPYRDSFDYKPPGIFLIYAALIAVFGEAQWPIRLAELGCVSVLGFLCARLATTKSHAGLVGFSVLTAHLLYYGFFIYWDTAQCEIWCVTFAMAALLSAYRMESSVAASIISGALASLALLMKPSGAPIVLVVLVVVLARSPKQRAERLFGFVSGLAVAPLLLFLYFALNHASSALLDVLRADRAYVIDARRVGTLESLWSESVVLFQWFNPYASMALALVGAHFVASVAAKEWGSLRRFGLAAATIFAAYLGVAMQLKFYHYHWALLVGPGALFAACAVAEISERIPDRQPWVASAAALFVLAIFPLSGPPATNWWHANANGISWAIGRHTRQQFAHQHTIPSLFYNYGDSESAGEWLRDHSSNDDTIAVRGFEPEVYAVAHRRFSGRFFWTVPLTDPKREFNRALWLAEDRAALERTAPKFVVALRDARGGPESAQYFTPLGYETRVEFGALTILERKPGPTL